MGFKISLTKVEEGQNHISCNGLRILIHYYTCSGPYVGTEDPSYLSKLHLDLSKKHLVMRKNENLDWEAGPALATYLEAVLSVPFPRQVWGYE